MTTSLQQKHWRAARKPGGKLWPAVNLVTCEPPEPGSPPTDRVCVCVIDNTVFQLCIDWVNHLYRPIAAGSGYIHPAGCSRRGNKEKT